VDQLARRDGGDDRDEFGRGGQFFPGGGGGGGGRGGGFQGGGGAFGQAPGGAGGQGLGPGGAAGGLLPTGIQPGDLYAYDADNSIIVRYTDERALRELRKVISFLDVKPRQVMIKAEFITVTQNDVSSFGINWSFAKVNLVAGVNAGFQANSTAFLQFASGNFQAQLSWILTTGRGKIVASPMATTLNNLPVAFFVSNQTPIFLSTPVISAVGTVALAPTITIANAITGVAVIPRINGDDSLTLFGAVTVQDFPSTVTGPNGETAPTFIAQTAPIQRIIRNGDTMVIGGLTRKRETVSTNKVPLLGDLPIIGTLFRSRSVTVDDSDLLVFITPTIIPERAPNAPISGLSGTPAAPGGPGGAGGGTTP
jgi:general secretion pathway protein D